MNSAGNRPWTSARWTRVAFVLMLSAASGSVHAAKLDKEACAGLASELAAITATGIKAEMERGPDWGKANMSADRLRDVRRVLELEDELQFRCGARGIYKPAEPAPAVPAATTINANAVKPPAAPTAVPPSVAAPAPPAAASAPAVVQQPPAATGNGKPGPAMSHDGQTAPATTTNSTQSTPKPPAVSAAPAPAKSTPPPATGAQSAAGSPKIVTVAPPPAALGGPPAPKVTPPAVLPANPPAVAKVPPAVAAPGRPATATSGHSAPIVAANPPVSPPTVGALPPVTKTGPLPSAAASVVPATGAATAARKKNPRRTPSSAYVSPNDVSPFALPGMR